MLKSKAAQTSIRQKFLSILTLPFSGGDEVLFVVIIVSYLVLVERCECFHRASIRYMTDAKFNPKKALVPNNFEKSLISTSKILRGRFCACVKIIFSG